MSALIAVTRASLLAQFRSFANLFFGFLFPIVFIAVFGLVGSGSITIRIGVTNDSDVSSPIYQALTHISVVKLSQGAASDLNTQLKNGTLDGVLSIQDVQIPAPATTPGAVGQGTSPGGTIPGYAVTLATSSAAPQSAGTAKALVEGIEAQVNARVALSVANIPPPVTLTEQDVAGRTYSYIDFALPGQLGFALLGIAVFGTAFGFVVLKRTLVLKRIFATPTRPSIILLGQGISRLVIALLQVLVLIGAGIWLFHFHLANGVTTFLEMGVVSLFGLVAFLGFGLVIAGNFKDENAMGPVVNLITLPQFLLSGTFFPTDNFPKWLQPIANNLPLSYLNTALRDIANNGASLYDVRWQLLGILGWGVASYVIAVFTFKWE